MDERSQQLSESIKRESEWRIVSERAAECERLRLQAEDRVRELEFQLGEEQRRGLDRDRVIEVARSEMEKLAKRMGSEIMVKDSEIAAMRKDNMSLRVTVEELDKRRRIEIDQISKKVELERKENEQLKDYYKQRIEDQNKAIEDLKRLLTKETFRLPASTSQTQADNTNTRLGMLDEEFFRAFNRNGSLSSTLYVEPQPLIIDRERFVEKLVPTTLKEPFQEAKAPDFVEGVNALNFSFHPEMTDVNIPLVIEKYIQSNNVLSSK